MPSSTARRGSRVKKRLVALARSPLRRLLRRDFAGLRRELGVAIAGVDQSARSAQSAVDALAATVAELRQRLDTLERAVDDARRGAREDAHVDRWYRHHVHEPTTRLDVAPTAVVNNALFNCASGTIVVRDWAFFGHDVQVLAAAHDYRLLDRARQVMADHVGHDIEIGRGVWIGSGAVVVGPCRIGDHAVVAAGAVVRDDVAPLTIVAGNPARQVAVIEPHASQPTPDEQDASEQQRVSYHRRP